MGIYYYALNPSSMEAVCLGKKLKNELRDYEGPVVFLGTRRFFIPDVYLKMLLERFNQNEKSFARN